MTPGHAHYADWDAAYVLGSLSPAERREFETHLEGCERCRAVGRANCRVCPVCSAELDAVTRPRTARADRRRVCRVRRRRSPPLPADLVARIERREPPASHAAGPACCSASPRRRSSPPPSPSRCRSRRRRIRPCRPPSRRWSKSPLSRRGEAHLGGLGHQGRDELPLPRHRLGGARVDTVGLRALGGAEERDRQRALELVGDQRQHGESERRHRGAGDSRSPRCRCAPIDGTVLLESVCAGELLLGSPSSASARRRARRPARPMRAPGCGCRGTTRCRPGSAEPPPRSSRGARRSGRGCRRRSARASR